MSDEDNLMIEEMLAATASWDARFAAWLASLPPDHPARTYDIADQAAEFEGDGA
jgi:hypothetical protein